MQSATLGRSAGYRLHHAFELDLDVLGRHLLAQDRPQLGVERAGGESVRAVVPISLIYIPSRELLNPAAAQALLAAIGAGRYRRLWLSTLKTLTCTHFIALCPAVRFGSLLRRQIASEGVLEPLALVAIKPLVLRSNLVRADTERLEHPGEPVLGERLAALPQLWPRA